MATAARLDLLAYFLAMARAESETSARAASPSITLLSADHRGLA